MCSWYSTAREISGISGIYFWSKLCVEPSEQRWEKWHCLVNNSILRSFPRESSPWWSTSPGLLPQLGVFTMWSRGAGSPATLLHGGKSCLWPPQAAPTLRSTGALSPELPGSLCPCPSAGREMCSSVVGWGWSGWLRQHVCSSSPLSSGRPYIFGVGKQFNSAASLPSTIVAVLALTSPDSHSLG